jgi:cob(I)alamin adenosyltransferase
MPIYTRTGDDGTTALYGGRRVLKCEELVDVYGSIDELNSWIGFIHSSVNDDSVKDFLISLQKDLFCIGSTLAGWNGDLSPLRARVSEIENRIDVMEKTLPPLANFILPGGCRSASMVHIARSICRRVERQMVKMAQGKTFPVNEKDKTIIFEYLNRLSDLFFVLARSINKGHAIKEVVWSKTK